MQPILRFARALTGALPFLAVATTAGAVEQNVQNVAVAAASTGARADKTLLDKPALLIVKDVPLPSALVRLHRSAGVPIVFSESFVPGDTHVNCSCHEVTVRQALDQLLTGTNLRYVQLRSQVVIEPWPAFSQSARIRLASVLQPTPMLSPSLQPPQHATAIVETIIGPGGRVAAQEGTIRGRVVHEATLEPLAAVQVHVPDQAIGTLTDGEGRYVLQVPAGELTLRAQLLGYESATATVQVSAGGSKEVDFQLERQAIALDEIVVTGAGAPTQRRQLGQTINSISAEDLATAPVASIQDALQGRIPGLTAQAVGETGAAAHIVLRGTVSLSQRNEPLLYVDGVRMDNSRTAVSGTSANRLADINPADIERIEVIKGAAAATLFGTEASSGVIQVFTKRGAVQDRTYTFRMDQQLIHLPHSKWPYNSQWHPGLGRVVTDRPAEAFVDLGTHQNYSLSLRGGGEGAQYFVSGRWMNEDGPMPNNTLSNASLRASFDFKHSDRLSSTLDLSWVNSMLEVPQPDWSSTASDFVLSQPIRATEEFPHGRSGCQCYDIGDLLRFTHNADTKNVLLGGNFSYRVGENVLASVRIGYNDVTTRGVAFRPEGITPPGEYLSRGYKQVQNHRTHATTIDAKLTWGAPLTDRLQSTLTIGGQSFWEGSTRESVAVQDFASPTLETLRGGSSIVGVDESVEEVINAGIFLQEQIGLDDRLFLTGGLRMDGNSAFGEDFGFSYYPKAGLSWVVSEHDFFNVPGVDDLRVRGAVGTSGLQPGAFDAQRTWQPGVFGGGIPLVSPLNRGNAELKPERSTEREIAIETGLFGGRVGLEAIYYNQTTSDALLPWAPPPAGGFTYSQLINIGTLSSKGVELIGNFQLLDSPSFGWTLNAAYTWINQRVTDMGSVADFRVTTRRRWNWIAEGHSPGVIIAPVQDPDDPYDLAVPVEELTDLDQIEPNVLLETDGTEKLFVIGNALPTWTVSFGSRFRFGDELTLSALFLGAGGFMMSNETEIIRGVARINPWTSNLQAILKDPDAAVEQRQAVADEFGRKHPGVISSHMEAGDWLKLNELALTYRVPDRLSNLLGLQQTTLSLGGRNLILWTRYSGIVDPGSTVQVDGVESAFLPNIDYLSTPSPRRYVFTLRTSW